MCADVALIPYPMYSTVYTLCRCMGILVWVRVKVRVRVKGRIWSGKIKSGQVRSGQIPEEDTLKRDREIRFDLVWGPDPDPDYPDWRSDAR